jgi:hypothetical protein
VSSHNFADPLAAIRAIGRCEARTPFRRERDSAAGFRRRSGRIPELICLCTAYASVRLCRLLLSFEAQCSLLRLTVPHNGVRPLASPSPPQSTTKAHLTSVQANFGEPQVRGRPCTVTGSGRVLCKVGWQKAIRFCESNNPNSTRPQAPFPTRSRVAGPKPARTTDRAIRVGVNKRPFKFPQPE